MTAPAIRGWCPGALRPMPSGDGLVVRVRPPGGRLTPAQALTLADAAARFGAGVVDLTARASLQLRGVDAADHPTLIEALGAAGLVDADAAVEARRNIVVTPFADTQTDALAARLTEALAGGPDLPGKFGFAVDSGPAPALAATSADIRLERAADGTLILRADGCPLGAPVSEAAAPDAAVALARWFVAAGGASADGVSGGGVSGGGAAADLAAARATSTDAAAGAGAASEAGAAAARPVTAGTATAGTATAGTATAGGVSAGPAKTGAATPGAATANRAPVGRGRMAALIARGARPPGALAPRLPPAPPLPPPLPGRVPQGTLVAAEFGQMTAGTLGALATLGPMRLTPWRMLLVGGCGTVPPLPGLMLQDDPMLRVHACTGAPGCVQGVQSTRPLARRLAAALPAGAVLHVSGCAKGCAHPGPADLTLTATPQGYDLIRGGRAGDAPLRRGLDPLTLTPEDLT